MPAVVFSGRRARAACIVAWALACSAACARADHELTAAAESRLAIDSVTSSFDVEVVATGGVLRLSGQVPSRSVQQRALTLTRAVDGAEDVVDAMRLADETVAQAVRAALQADPLVQAAGIEVEVTNGVARLTSGNTDAAQRARATRLVSGTDGVLAIDDRMR